MTDLEANAIIGKLTRKHKTFRVIEKTIHAGGVNIVFVDLPTTNIGVISGWVYDAGGIPLFVGREWINNGFVMHMRLRA